MLTAQTPVSNTILHRFSSTLALHYSVPPINPPYTPPFIIVALIYAAHMTTLSPKEGSGIQPANSSGLRGSPHY